jgi:hypothetical protein
MPDKLVTSGEVEELARLLADNAHEEWRIPQILQRPDWEENNNLPGGVLGINTRTIHDFWTCEVNLIVALRNSAPNLLANIRAQQAEIERLREAVRLLRAGYTGNIDNVLHPNQQPEEGR